MITVYTFFKQKYGVRESVWRGGGERETTYLNPEYSQTSYALLKKSPKELHMD